MTIPRSLAVLLAGTILAASLTACGGSPAAPQGATSPTQRPYMATFAANQRRLEPTREAEETRNRLEREQQQRDRDQRDREAKMRDDVDKQLRDSERRARCEAENAAARAADPNRLMPAAGSCL